MIPSALPVECRSFGASAPIYRRDPGEASRDHGLVGCVSQTLTCSERGWPMVTAISEADERIVRERVRKRRDRFAANTTGFGLKAFSAIVVLMFVAWIALRQYTQLLVMAGGVLIMAIGAWLYPVFRRIGLGTYGIPVFIGMILLIAFSWPLLVPEVMPAVPIACVFATLLGNLLLGDYGGRWVASLCGFGLAVDYVSVNLWTPQWFPSLGETATWMLSAVISVFGFAATALMVRTVTMEQEGSYADAQRAGLDVEKRAAAEKAQRELLQSTVERYVEYMSRVSRGDLSVRLLLDEQAFEEDDPLIVLGRSLNETVTALQRMVMQTRDAATKASSSTAEILATTSQQVAGATQQSVAVSQASTTIDEVRTIAEQTAQRAQSVSELAQQTVEVSRRGQQAVVETIRGMEEVKTKVESIATEILSLSEQAQSIGQIVSTVNEIAAQSNMLALNAAVEAARAGEVGKGFSVVAGEVRSLAEQSRAATERVEEILSAIQGGINTAVMATEEGMKGVDDGVRRSREAGEAIRQLGDSVTESTQAATQIAAAAGQQQIGVEQIAQAMQSIDQATAQNVAGARQSESAANELDVLSRELLENVEQYQL